MSNDEVVTSKEVQPGFTAKLLYDEDRENPRRWGAQVTGMYFWDDLHEDLSDSIDIGSYEDAIRELYQKVYPELIGWCLEEEPPQEILDLIDQTPYPGIIRWIKVMDERIETLLVPMPYPDTEDLCMGGVAFISDEELQKTGYTREEGEILIQHDLLILEQYINGNVYLLKIHRDDEIEYLGGIYLENTHTPRNEELDNYLLEIGLEMGISPEEELLISATRWDR